MSTAEHAAASPLILGTMGWGVPVDDGEGPHSAGPGAGADVALARARGALRAGLEAGITVLDTADIYGGGLSESTTGALLAELDPAERGRLRVQTKAGIVLPGQDPAGGGVTRYDSSPAHVRRALEGSLSRLGAGAVETLIIHRPDVLTPVEDTVRAFLDAREAGLVRRLGVSNLGTGRLLSFQRALGRLAADGTGLACAQLELGLHHRTLVEAEVLANHGAAPATAGAADLGRVCAEEGIELQAWGPLGQGRFTPGSDGSVPTDPAEAAALASAGGPAAVVAQVAQELGAGREAVVLAWLLKLPWGVRPVVGSQGPARLAACAAAPEVAAAMDAAQWHRLWTAARGENLP